MCKCTPNLRTPFCGKGDCVWPREKNDISKRFPGGIWIYERVRNCDKYFKIYVHPTLGKIMTDVISHYDYIRKGFNMRFNYVKYDEQAMKQQQELKAAFEAVEKLVDRLPDGRPKSLIYTKLEEAYMWTGKAIRDDQIARNGFAEEQPERNNDI